MMKHGTECILQVFFSLDKNDKNYSERWRYMDVWQDYDNHTITTQYLSRWNSNYDEITTVKY